MKLNMIVVITMWLPRRACRYAGIAAHAAPNAIAPMIATGNASSQWGQAKDMQTRAAPSPPSVAWPSPPILNSFAWKATATAKPVNTKFVA